MGFSNSLRGRAHRGRSRYTLWLSVALLVCPAFARAETPPATPLEFELRVEHGRVSASDTLVWRRDGETLLSFRPIARSLGARLRRDPPAKLRVRRAPDGASFVLDFETGEVEANGRAVGFVPRIELADFERLILPIPAVEALTGTRVTIDEAKRQVHVELDRRLRSVFGFELRVEQRPLPFADPPPRAIGSVLLLPLRPIVEELGSTLELDEVAGEVRVLRAQDEARMTIDLRTGLARVNGRVAGRVPDFSYARREELLLPSEAIEFLTGTHVTIVASERRIEVELDQALRDVLGPDPDGFERARESGPVLETFGFRVGDDITNEFALRGRTGAYNLRLDYHTPGLIESDGLTPSRLALAFDSIDGHGGTLGTYAAERRELSAVGVSRLRGLTLYRPVDGGDLVFLLGQPADGSHQLDNGGSVASYDGFSAGARFYAEGGGWEAGVSSLVDASGSNRAAVGSYRRRFQGHYGRLGRGTHHQDLDFGFFSLDADHGGGDGRARWDSRFEPTDELSIATQLSYEGVNFSRNLLGIDDARGIGLAADTLTTGINAARSWNDWLATNTRASLRRTRLLAGDSELEASGTSLGFGVNALPFARGPGISFDYTFNSNDSRRIGSEQFGLMSLRLSQRLRKTDLSFRYEREHGDRERSLSSLEASRLFYWRIFDETWLHVGPRLSASRSEGDYRLSLGGIVSLNGLKLFDERLILGLDYSHVEAVETLDAESDSGSSLFGARATLRLSRNLELDLSYRTAFDGDDSLRGIVRGHMGFNPRRRFQMPESGAGVLTGLVFLDENWDGRRDPDERGLGSVPVQILRSGLALRTAREGNFTIQNLKAGLYRLALDLHRLPIGLQMHPDGVPGVRVADGQLTHLEIPVVETSQIYGRIYEDLNHNDQLDPGEPGIEGLRLLLEPGGHQTYTTAFGQFSVGGLRPGAYEVHIDRSFSGTRVRPPLRIVVGLPTWARTTTRLDLPVAPPKN